MDDVYAHKSKKQRRQERQRQQEEKREHRQYDFEHMQLMKEKYYRRDNPLPPPHPDSNILIKPDATLQISSGGLCFGMKHNCSYGASQDLVKDPIHCIGADLSEEFSSYFRQECCFNVRARNGEWRGYHLFERRTPSSPILTSHSLYGDTYSHILKEKDRPIFHGSFVCHSSINPVDEVRRLVYHSDDNISTTNELIQTRIIVINRYDWGVWDLKGYFHKNGKKANSPYPISSESEEWQDDKEVEEMEEDGFIIIDYEECRQKNWDAGLLGIRTENEMYGRIGFRHRQAISFLFYNAGQPFDNIYFTHSRRPLGERLDDESDVVFEDNAHNEPLSSNPITNYFARR